jgi:hypothetical protein
MAGDRAVRKWLVSESECDPFVAMIRLTSEVILYLSSTVSCTKKMYMDDVTHQNSIMLNELTRMITTKG